MKFLKDLESIRMHRVPKWYEDDKVGIFIHWGAYSVPAFAPVTHELGEVVLDEDHWFSQNPYAEWYMNSLRIGHGPTYDHHVKKYGESFSYEEFTHSWKAEKWNPAEWAELFRKSGAKYVVPTTKHHDGFCLWNSEYTNYTTVNRGPKRDIVTELTDAVREKGLKMGLYYSGILDWQYAKTPVRDEYDINHPENVTFTYSDYAFNQVMELINKYKPDLIWNDIAWPEKGLGDLPTLFAHYYNTVPQGVVNDRWSGVWSDFTTKEYQLGEMTLDKKWEMCRGLGLSFGYNQEEGEEHLISKNGLISLLLSSVAHNGNLLINIGPKADGTIPEGQKERLLYMGDWLNICGDGIYGTRPYRIQKQQAEKDVTIYFTQKEKTVYAFLDHVPEGDSKILLKNIEWKSEDMRMVSPVNASFSDSSEGIWVELKNIDKNMPAICISCGN